MALTPANADLTLTATNQAILTVMATNGAFITKALVLNTDTATRGITIYKVPSGGTAATGNKIISPTGAAAFSLGPGETKVLPLSGVGLTLGGSLQGFATATNVVNIAITYTVSG